MEKPRRRKKQLPPFFDHLDNPEFHHFPRGEEVDGTPPPPHLAPFDRGVLKVCGNIAVGYMPPIFRHCSVPILKF
jgi:hypothetical protein